MVPRRPAVPAHRRAQRRQLLAFGVLPADHEQAQRAAHAAGLQVGPLWWRAWERGCLLTCAGCRRLKIALITIGISAVLMVSLGKQASGWQCTRLTLLSVRQANVTFVGFLTPPNPPEVLLYEVGTGVQSLVCTRISC